MFRRHREHDLTPKARVITPPQLQSSVDHRQVVNDVSKCGLTHNFPNASGNFLSIVKKRASPELMRCSQKHKNQHRIGHGQASTLGSMKIGIPFYSRHRLAAGERYTVIYTVDILVIYFLMPDGKRRCSLGVYSRRRHSKTKARPRPKCARVLRELSSVLEAALLILSFNWGCAAARSILTAKVHAHGTTHHNSVLGGAGKFLILTNYVYKATAAKSGLNS